MCANVVAECFSLSVQFHSLVLLLPERKFDSKTEPNASTETHKNDCIYFFFHVTFFFRSIVRSAHSLFPSFSLFLSRVRDYWYYYMLHFYLLTRFLLLFDVSQCKIQCQSAVYGIYV